mgnify:CR=1 FL=1
MSTAVELNDSHEHDDELNYIRSARGRRAIGVAREQEHKPRLTRVADQAHSNFKAAEAFNIAPTGFNPTFKGKRFEEEWLRQSLGSFYDDSLISDVLSQVKGGKEANVYCCLAYPGLGPRWLAAKIFRPRMFRNLKNDAAYREGGELIGRDGKAMRKKREQTAVAQRTKIGLAMLHQSWLSNEHGTLTRLHAAGALTPKPWGVNGNTILMDFLGEQAMPAPALNHVDLEPAEGRRLFEQMVSQLRLMLKADVVHGDLSAFNILYWQGEIRIIDFPQAVNPWRNPNAFRFFTRDVTRVIDYFSGYGVNANPEGLARALWREAYGAEAGERLGE